jgi:hypothetical protein
MTDNSATQALRAHLRLEDDSFWSILEKLADKEEKDLRKILRPHAEAGFDRETDDEIMDQRQHLDEVLEALTLLEIAREFDLVKDVRDHIKYPDQLEMLLRKSPAMLCYADAYLYFGIRFLGGRIARPTWMNYDPLLQDPLVREQDSQNHRDFALRYPPPLGSTENIQANFARFLSVTSGDQYNVGLKFLDDFVDDLKEPEWFDLWLRGLQPDIPGGMEGRFKAISNSLAEWAIARSRFYMGLEPDADKGPSLVRSEVNPEQPAEARRQGEGEPLREVQPSIEGRQEVEVGPGQRGPIKRSGRPAGGWMVTAAESARFGLRDMYWIARLLRADVSEDARVSYRRTSWLHLLRFQAELQGNRKLENDLWDAEEILRSVFDFVCDLVQNSVALSDELERLAYQTDILKRPPWRTVKWREVFDEEMTEIERERARRLHTDSDVPDGYPPLTPPREVHSAGSSDPGDGWANRIKTGKQPQHLIGLAVSGGGIRSATFALGVLQGLQELDLLRSIDYLSTVSGGGFIGSWLIGNVVRTKHWLGRLTSWEDSIAHLRRYSNYLAPRTGVLSTDTWTMWATWARNALLIQITAMAWLFALFSGTFLVHGGFNRAGEWPLALCSSIPVSGAIAGVLMAVLLGILLYSMTGLRPVPRKRGRTEDQQEAAERDRRNRYSGLSAKAIRRFAVVPAWLTAFLVASLLWADATGRSALSGYFAGMNSYSAILLNAWRPWLPLLIIVAIALFAIAWSTLSRHDLNALWISPVTTFALYLQLCGIMRIFLAWASDAQHFSWYAYVFGPPMVLFVNTVSVVLFIGFCGRNSNEPMREWWTKFGTWLGIYGFGYLALTAAAVFGPLWMILLGGAIPRLKWAALAGWVGSVASGLMAGNSSKTSGNGTKSKSPLLEVVAKLGGLLFIIGAMLGAATLLYVLLVNIGTDYDLLPYWMALEAIPRAVLWSAVLVAGACGVLFSWFFEINIFGLNQFYRNRLVRCYLGATRWTPGMRKPQPFTNFDGQDDMRMGSILKMGHRGPFPILNCSLNLGGSSDLALHTRHSASFSLTPLRCGADRPRVGYAPTRAPGQNGGHPDEFAGGVMLGQAVAISGAAASPNMGYNTSPLVAFLLTMFNVRLGWWYPNPGGKYWTSPGLRFSLYYLLQELVGIADERKLFVNVSDGGHFENLGIYELVRRRCKVIIASDAECDESLTFGSLGNVVRLCETDFGAKIDIDVSSIRQQKDGFSLAHCAIGRITYCNGSIGHLIYLKASISGDEDVSVTQYRSVHPSFPHETTADQFFSEDQFESYRTLGLHVIRHSLRGNEPGDDPVAIAEKLADVLAPARSTSKVFVAHTKVLTTIWERFRHSRRLTSFMNELNGTDIPVPTPPLQHEELCLGLELIQLMEDVFLDLRLDDFWEHPDNRGWAILFMRWARSPRFRQVWNQTHRTFGIRFEYFCAARLGLSRDNPIVRV